MLRAGHSTVHQIKKTGADDHQSGIKKHALLILCRSVSEEECGPGVDHKPHEREHVGIDFGEREPADNRPQQNCASPPESASPGHVRRIR